MAMHDRQITEQMTDPTLRLRAECATWLVHALEACHPDDGAEICAAYLQTTEQGGPWMRVLYDMQARDAQIWALAAPPHELIAHTLAGLKRLPQKHLSLPARKALFKHLWRSFSPADRAAFLAHVQGGK